MVAQVWEGEWSIGRMTAKEYKISFCVYNNILKLIVGDVCITVNILEIIELHTLSGQTVW